MFENATLLNNTAYFDEISKTIFDFTSHHQSAHRCEATVNNRFQMSRTEQSAPCICVTLQFHSAVPSFVV